MQIVFSLVCMTAGLLFWKRRRIDPMLLGFAACIVYFSPGFYGHIDLKYPWGSLHNADIEPGAYAVMIIVVAATTLAALPVDKVGSPRQIVLPVRYVSPLLLAVALGAAATSMFTIGRGYLCEKVDLLPNLDLWYTVASYTAPLVFAVAWAERAPIVITVAAFLLLADCLIGFRIGTAITAMAIGLLHGQNLTTGRRALLTYGLVIVVAGIGFIGLRTIFSLIPRPAASFCVANPPMAISVHSAPGALPRSASGQPIASDILRRPPDPEVLGEVRTFRRFIASGEPFIVQATLNEVVRSNFTTDRAYLVDAVKNMLPLANTLFGLDLIGFNLLFQPVLFPQVPIGMANNPWAQAYAAGGYGLVAIFAMGYAGGLALLTLLFRATQGAPQAVIAVLSGWWGFYSHRNDLLIEIGILKLVLYISAGVLFVGWLVARLSNGRFLQTDQQR